MFQFATVGNNWISSSLIKNKTYYWRLRPYNAQHTCEAYSDIHSFTTGDQLSSIEDDFIDGLSGLTILPNPIPSGMPLTVGLSLDRNLSLNIQFMTLAGESILSAQWQVSQGQTKHQLELPELPNGFYVLKVGNASGQMVRKVLVTH